MVSLSFATRTFLMSSLALGIALGMTFFATGALVQKNMKRGLKESLYRTELAINGMHADVRRNASRLVEVLSENAGLKAGISLFREGGSDPSYRAQLRATLEDQLREMGQRVDCDFLLLADVDNVPVAGIWNRHAKPFHLEALKPASTSAAILELNLGTYEISTVPSTSETRISACSRWESCSI